MVVDGTEVDVTENKLTDKITSLRLIATDFERRVTGWRQTDKGGKWIYTGDVLVGSSTASRLTGILQSFCNEINLISENDNNELAWQQYKNMNAMLSSTLMDIYCEEQYNTVAILFSNALNRILRVIGTSKGMFKNYFRKETEEEIKPQF